jgi:hypothetical protein
VPSSIHSLFLSRVPIALHLPSGSMTTDQRIERMGASAPPTERFSKESIRIPNEAEIVSALAVLGAGLEAPGMGSIPV